MLHFCPPKITGENSLLPKFYSPCRFSYIMNYAYIHYLYFSIPILSLMLDGTSIGLTLYSASICFVQRRVDNVRSRLPVSGESLGSVPFSGV